MSKEKDRKFDFKKLPAFKMMVFVLLGLITGLNAYWTNEKLLWVMVLGFALILIFFRIKYYTILFITASVLIGVILSFRAADTRFLTANKIIPDTPALFSGEIGNLISRNDKFSKIVVNGKIEPKGFGEIDNTSFVLNIYSDYPKFKLFTGQKIHGKMKVKIPSKKVLPNAPDEERIAALYEVQWFGKSKSSEIALKEREKGIKSLRDKLRDYLWDASDILFSESTRAILYALSTGDQTKIPKDIQSIYSLTGTSHVLAVSGLHVGLISVFFLMLTAFFRNRSLKFILFVVLIASYVFLCGSQPSAVRAGVFAIIIYYCYLRELKVTLLNVISFTIILMLIVKPDMIYSAGFLMSSAAVLGLAFLYVPITEKMKKLGFSKDNKPGFVISSISLTISASIAVTPITAYYFGIFSVVSVFANIIIVPLTSLALIFSLLAFSVYPLWYACALLFANCADLLIYLSNNINSFLVGIPFSAVKSYEMFFLSVVISSLLLFIILSKNKRMMIFRAVGSVVATFIIVVILQKDATFEIYPRDNNVVCIMQLKDNLKLVYVSDRKNTNKAIRDYYLEQYLSGMNDSLYFVVTGISSLRLADELKKSAKIKRIVPLDIESQRKLNRLLGCNDKMPQLIKLSN